MKYFVGERIMYGNIIATICMPPDEDRYSTWDYWIDNPAVGYKHGVAKSNLHPYEQDAIAFREANRR